MDVRDKGLLKACQPVGIDHDERGNRPRDRHQHRPARTARRIQGIPTGHGIAGKRVVGPGRKGEVYCDLIAERVKGPDRQLIAKPAGVDIIQPEFHILHSVQRGSAVDIREGKIGCGIGTAAGPVEFQHRIGGKGLARSHIASIGCLDRGGAAGERLGDADGNLDAAGVLGKPGPDAGLIRTLRGP